MYQEWLFKDCPGGWRLRYRRNGGGYEVSRDGERWERVPSVTEVTGRLNKNLQDWAVRQVVEYLRGELVPGLVLTEEEVAASWRGPPGPTTGPPRVPRGGARNSTPGRRPTSRA